MKSYLLIDSTYRNRLQYPNPADFEIPFQTIQSQVLNPTLFTAMNPITLPYPDYNFVWFYTPTESLQDIEVFIVGGTASTPILSAAIDTVLGINGHSHHYFTSLESAQGIFNNLRFYYTDTSFLIIVDYDPITRILVLDGNIPDFHVTDPPQRAVIRNPSTPAGIFLQGDLTRRSPVVYSSAIPEFFLWDLTVQEIVRIVEYTPTNLLLLERPFDPLRWRVDDAYMLISQQNVLNYGTLEPFPDDQWYLPNTVWTFRILQAGCGYVRNDLVYAIGLTEGRDSLERAAVFRIRSLTLQGGIDELDLIHVGLRGYCLNQSYRLVSVINNEIGIASSIITITDTLLTFRIRFETPITTPAAYKEAFFFPVVLSEQFIVDRQRLKLNGNATLPRRPETFVPRDILTSMYENGIVGIKDIVQDPFDVTVLYIRTQAFPEMLLRKFQYLPTDATKDDRFYRTARRCLLLPYSREGVVALNFTGSTLTQSQASCYAMTVISLILPNVTIDVNPGPLTSFFPFVYLELSNVSSSNARNKSILYSNNPYTTNVTFICSISDVNNPINAKFIKITSDGASQTLKFTPVDSLRFRISLPNGNVFKTETTDYLVPVDPDPRLQIHAVIEIERL